VVNEQLTFTHYLRHELMYCERLSSRCNSYHVALYDWRFWLGELHCLFPACHFVPMRTPHDCTTERIA
jgi:hypothetical protein